MPTRKRPPKPTNKLSASPEQQQKDASKALRIYNMEVQRRTVVQVIAGTFIGISALLLVMVLSGDRFDGILSVIGLRGFANSAKGIYADCSKRENQTNPLCYQKGTQSEEDWKRLDEKSSRFKLSR